MITNKWARIGTYVGALAAGATAIGFGVADSSDINQWLTIILGALGVTAGGTALTNLTPDARRLEARPVTAAQVESLVRDAVAGIGDRLAEPAAELRSRAEQVVQARRDLEAHVGES